MSETVLEFWQADEDRPDCSTMLWKHENPSKEALDIIEAVLAGPSDEQIEAATAILSAKSLSSFKVTYDSAQSPGLSPAPPFPQKGWQRAFELVAPVPEGFRGRIQRIEFWIADEQEGDERE